MSVKAVSFALVLVLTIGSSVDVLCWELSRYTWEGASGACGMGRDAVSAVWIRVYGNDRVLGVEVKLLRSAQVIGGSASVAFRFSIVARITPVSSVKKLL